MIARAICPVVVGREDEISRLEDALLGACRGEGAVVVLAGDAGMGKSRLCSELERRAEKIGAAVMEGSCPEAELALPYLPFLEAIGNHLELTPAAPLGERLGVHRRELANLFPQLGGAEPSAAGPQTPESKLRLYEAVLALLRIEAQEHGLLLVIEDVHWADASTRELLDYLARRIRNTRILLLTTYRRDEMHRRHPLLPTLQSWQRARLAEMIELDPLPPAGVARMVSAIFDHTQVGEEFRDFIHARSEGNPFVLEEMLKAALDRGDIYRVDEAWERKPISDFRIPETVRDTILLRVERLDPTEAEILRCAAVLGRSFSYQALIAISGRDRGAVEQALQSAAQEQLVEEEPGREGRYRFRHALTQEAIYDDLSAPKRERLHSAAAEAVSGENSICEVALHLRAANRWEEAKPATLAAAEDAERRYGFEEAAELYTLLLPVTSGLERARLLCRLGEAYWRASASARGVDPLQEGVAALEAAGERLEAARHRVTLGRVIWEMNKPALAQHEYERARTVLEEAGPSSDLALAYIRLAGMAVFEVDAPAAARLAQKAIDIADAAGAEAMRTWAYNFLGVARCYSGAMEEGIALLERSYREARERELHDIAGNALHNLIGQYSEMLQSERLFDTAARLRELPSERWGVLSALFAESIGAWQRGEIGRALDCAVRLAASARRSGLEAMAVIGDRGAAYALVELDDVEESRQHSHPRSPDAQRQDSTSDAWIEVYQAEAAGEPAAALDAALFLTQTGHELWTTAEAVVDAARVLIQLGRQAEVAPLVPRLEHAPTPWASSCAKALKGLVALAEGRLDEARAATESALETFDAAGARTIAWRHRLDLARILAAAGDTAGAERELRRIVDDPAGRELRLARRMATAALAELGIALEEPPPLPVLAAEVPKQVGERLVTVLFADIRGYTAMTAEQPPAEMADRIAAYQRWAAEEVERNLGVMDKFAGDAAMATFNVSGAQVDHAAHALAAARALRDKAALLDLPVGIGIATGAAVVGRLKEGANLSVLGETTNLAARLQAAAGPGEILLSEGTRRRLGEEFEGLRGESLALKGFAEPVTAYRLAAGATGVEAMAPG